MGMMRVRNASVDTTTNEIDEMLRHPQLALVTSQSQKRSASSSEGPGPTSYSPIDPRNNPFAANSPERGGLDRGSPVDYEGLAYNEARGSFDDMPPAPLSAAAVAATALVRDPHTAASTAQMDPRHRSNTPGYAVSKQPYVQYANERPQHITAQQQQENDDWYGIPHPPPVAPGMQQQDPIRRTESPSQGARGLLPSQMRRNSQQLLSKSQTDLTKMNGGSGGGSAERSQSQAPPPLPPKVSPGEDEIDEEWRQEALGYLGYAGIGGTGGHYGR